MTGFHYRFPSLTKSRHILMASALAAIACTAAVARPAAYTSYPRAAAQRDPALFQQTMLYAQNDARARVGVAPLRWDDGLAAEAGAWAHRLAASHSFEHSDNEDEGENLWSGTRGYFSYNQMVGDWIDEGRAFSPAAGEDWDRTGHYSQIVWRGTTRVGCAIASDNDQDYVVCRYDPAGNVEGERAF